MGDLYDTLLTTATKEADDFESKLINGHRMWQEAKKPQKSHQEPKQTVLSGPQTRFVPSNGLIKRLFKAEKKKCYLNSCHLNDTFSIRY